MSQTFYKLDVIVNVSNNISYVGPLFPYFEASTFQQGISGSDVFVEDAIGINITVYNSTEMTWAEDSR